MINYEISRNKGDLDCHIFSHGEGCLLVYNDIKCDRTFVSVTSILISSILEYFVDWDSIPRLNDLDSHLALAKGLDALVYQVEKLCSQEDYFKTELVDIIPALNSSMKTSGVLSLMKIISNK